MVVLDLFTRRIVGSASRRPTSTVRRLPMFKHSLSDQPLPKHLSTDNDPLFRFHRWRATGVSHGRSSSKAHWKALRPPAISYRRDLELDGLDHALRLVCDRLGESQGHDLWDHLTRPNDAWMLPDSSKTSLTPIPLCFTTKRYLIVDRDTKYTAAFRAFLAREGLETIRLPPRSPNLNAYAERFVKSVKDDCLSKLIPLSRLNVATLLAAIRCALPLERITRALVTPLLSHRANPHFPNAESNAASDWAASPFYHRVARDLRD